MDRQRARVTICPNSACSLELDEPGEGGYCNGCGGAWLACGCGGTASPLWGHCPRCGAAVAELRAAHEQSGLSGRAPKAFHQKIEERVTSAPVNHGGYLWWLTGAGNLYRISPAGHKSLVEVLGEDFAGATLALVPQQAISAISKPQAREGSHTGSSGRILLAVAGSRNVAFLDPALAGTDTPGRMRHLPLPPDAQLVLDPDAFTTIACTQTSLAAILMRDGKTFLGVREIRADADWRLIPLPELPAAGPLCLNDTFAIYTPQALYLVQDGALSRHPFPSGFTGLVLQRVWQMAKPWRRPPFFSLENGSLVPGQLAPSGNQPPQPAYLFAALQQGSSLPTFARLQIAPGSMSSEPYGGRVAFAATGELKQANQAVATVISRDGSIQPLPCATSYRWTAAYCNIPPNRHAIRLFPDDPRHFEVDSSDVLPVGLHLCHNWLVSTGLKKGGLPVIDAWSLT